MNRLLRRVVTVLVLLAPFTAHAQFGPPPTPTYVPGRDLAPFDISGNWVSIVTEDWRYRMVPVKPGDHPGVPLNAEGERISNAFDPAAAERERDACEAYGAPALMRIPTRLRISWQDKDTLKLETDAGRQTRLFHFGDATPPSAPSRQGHSVATWEMARGGKDGSLRVETSHLLAGMLRKNGIPYSADATVTEYIDQLTGPDGEPWLVVLTTVHDPAYLYEPFTVSTNFKREKNGRGWDPQACSLR